MLLLMLVTARNIIANIMARETDCSKCKLRPGKYFYLCCHKKERLRGVKFCHPCIKEQLVQEYAISVFYEYPEPALSKCPYCHLKNALIKGPNGYVDTHITFDTALVATAVRACSRIFREEVMYLNLEMDDRHTKLIDQVLKPFMSILNINNSLQARLLQN